MGFQNSSPERKPRSPRTPSFKYLTLQATADHYCVDESTIRKGVGVFGQLILVQPTPRRTLVLRSSVDKLDRALERAALAQAGVVSIEEGKRRRA